MSGNDVSKLFSITTQTGTDGKTIKGVTKDNFFAMAGSIFDEKEMSAQDRFQQIDANNDGFLSEEELAAATSFMNLSIQEAQDAASDAATASGSSLEGILGGNQSFTTKLNQVKSLNLSNEDVKGLDDENLGSLLNLVSGAYADNPQGILTDPLYMQIENNVPTERLQTLLTNGNSGYMLNKYGAPVIQPALTTKANAKSATGLVGDVMSTDYTYTANWGSAESAISNLSAGTVGTGTGTGGAAPTTYGTNPATNPITGGTPDYSFSNAGSSAAATYMNQTFGTGSLDWKADWSSADKALLNLGQTDSSGTATT